MYFLYSIADGLRMSSFGEQIQDVVKDFLDWTSRNTIPPEKVVYARIYELVTPREDSKCIIDVVLNDKGEAELSKHEGEDLYPFAKTEERSTKTWKIRNFFKGF